MLLIIYNLALKIWVSGLRIACCWNAKARQSWAGRKDIFLRIRGQMAGNTRPVVWMHSASLGEFEQGRSLLEKIREQYPGTCIVVTFFSPSGYEVMKNYEGADHIFYLPFSTRKNARKLIGLLQPRLVLWIKYDYWYHYLTELKKRSIPVLLVSAIFHRYHPFFKWYGGLHREMLRCFTWIFVQNPESEKRLASIGLSTRVSVSGDTRFDRVTDIAGRFTAIPPVESFIGKYPVIVAGSTWPEDEEELDHYANTHPDIKFVIAPHEIDEEHLKDIEKLFHRTVRYSRWAANQPIIHPHGPGLQQGAGSPDIQGAGAGNIPGPPGSQRNDTGTEQTGAAGAANLTAPPAAGGQAPNVLIIDNIGMLSRLYHYATIAYVGGGFGDDGVHNVLEAAVYGKPVIFGPVFNKFREAIDLLEEGAAFTVDNALQLEAQLNELLSHKTYYQESCHAAREYVYTHRGATATIMRYIQENRLLTS